MRDGTDRDCPDENEIVQFLEGSMVPAQRDGFERHVDRCALCADVLFGAAASAAARRPVLDRTIAPETVPSRTTPDAIPGRNRRWQPWAAAALGTVAIAWWTVRGADPCMDGARANEVWNPSRRTQIESVLVGIEPSVPAAQVVTAIDRHVEHWNEAHARACAAALAAADPRLACLQSNLVELRTLVDLFAVGDPDVLAQAAEAMILLPPPHTCESIEAAPASSTVQHADWKELGDEMARARALEHAGVLAEAERIELDVAARAQEHGWTALAARALAHAGRNETRLGEMDRGIELLRDAFFRASAVGADDVAAASATELAVAIGWWEHRPDEGESWMRQAAIHLERAGIDPSVDHDFQAAAGLVAERAGDLPRALEYQQRALETAGNPLDAAQAHTNLGNLLDASARPDEARVHYEAAVELLRANLGPRQVDTVEARAPNALR